MKIGNLRVKVFKIRNRKGYAGVCAGCLTEGRTVASVCDRMEKALCRLNRKSRKK